MAEKIVIIGGGIAGLSAAQAAREANSEARIHLICGEKRLPYYRPRICEIFSGLDPEKLLVRNHQWFIDMDIEVVNGRVASIDADKRQIKFTDSSYLFYDKLILATGARGNIPDAKGKDKDWVIPLRFMEDIRKISELSGPVVIIGDGLLGLEAAWHLSRAGRSVVIVGRGGRLLSHQLDHEGSVFFLSIVENAGVRVALNGDLAAVEEDLVVLEDGRGFEAAVVVCAAGIKSLTKLARNLGAECNNGIVVDEHMQTSLPDIWAAGDCVEYQGRVYGLWTASMAQGAVAGACAAGAAQIYQPERPGYMMNAMGTKVWSYGDILAEDGASVRDIVAMHFIKLFFAAGVLVGAEMIGDTSRMLAVKKAVDNAMPKAEAIKEFLPTRSRGN